MTANRLVSKDFWRLIALLAAVLVGCLALGSATPSAAAATTLTTTSSLKGGETLSGTYTWNVTANVPEASVQFYFMSNPLGDGLVTGSTSFTYKLDTTKYPNGQYHAGWRMYDSKGNYVAGGGSYYFTINNTPLAPPASITAPSVTGTVDQAQTLTAGAGTWSGTPTLAYQWQRCDGTGASCVAVAGATGTTYQIGSADAGSTLRVAVSATNASGTTTAYSPVTAAVPPVLATTTSIKGGETLSGVVTWTVTTNRPEARVDYYSMGAKLGSATGSTSFAYALDTTKYADGTSYGGHYEVFDASGALVYKSPAILWSISNAAPAPAPSPSPSPSPSPGGGSITWRGDYETGSLSQWDWGIQAASPSRITVVQSPLRQGRYAARFEVDPGDNNIAGSGTGERAEVLANKAINQTSAHEDWIAFSTMFDPSYQPTPNTDWNHFIQFHSSAGGTQASAFHVNNNQIKFCVYGGVLGTKNGTDWVLDSNRTNGVWYDFVVHIKWASDNTGFVEVWMSKNGAAAKKVVPLTYLPTMYSGGGVYLKEGLYRQGGSTTKAVIYDDGMRVGTSYSAVTADFPAGEWSSTAP